MTDRPKMTCRHAEDHGGSYCCMECYEQRLKHAKHSTAGAIAQMFEHLATKTSVRIDEKMYQHVAKLIRRWRDSQYGIKET